MPKKTNNSAGGAQSSIGRKEAKEPIISREAIRENYKKWLADKKLQSEHWRNQSFKAK